MKTVSEFELVVNGTECRVAVDPVTPLLFVLRNQLGLKGTRFGCGAGACGACMVLVGDRAETACNLPIEAVGGRPVTTVEGVGSTGALHPVQAAILRHQAAQCGYCLSGIVVAAKAMLDRAKIPPTIAEIGTSLAGNLCRCGAQPRLLRAIHEAGLQMADSAP